MDFTVYTFYNRPPKAAFLEPGGGPTSVENVYVDQNKRIKEMMAAGERLHAARAQQFEDQGMDFDEDTVMPDPTRSPGFDMADASRIERNLLRKKAAADNERKRQQKEPEKKAVQDEKGAGPGGPA